MKITKKCCLCGYSFTYDNQLNIKSTLNPAGPGAEYYFNLWHKPIEYCPNCGYSSLDISSTKNDKITSSEEYVEVENIGILKELKNARPNNVEAYLRSSIYYDSIGDKFNQSICALQAGDLVYAEMMYWEEYVLDNSTTSSALISKAMYGEIKQFADSLYNVGINALEEYISNNSSDIDAKILLAGVLGDGNRIQVMKGANMLNKLSHGVLSLGQRQAIEFLISDIT